MVIRHRQRRLLWRSIGSCVQTTERKKGGRKNSTISVLTLFFFYICISSSFSSSSFALYPTSSLRSFFPLLLLFIRLVDERGGARARCYTHADTVAPTGRKGERDRRERSVDRRSSDSLHAFCFISAGDGTREQPSKEEASINPLLSFSSFFSIRRRRRRLLQNKIRNLVAAENET